MLRNARTNRTDAIGEVEIGIPERKLEAGTVFLQERYEGFLSKIGLLNSAIGMLVDIILKLRDCKIKGIMSPQAHERAAEKQKHFETVGPTFSYTVGEFRKLFSSV